MSDGGSSSLKPSPAVLRAVAVLRVVAGAGGQPVALRDLAEQLGVPKSSIANICAALTETGLLRRHPGRAGYSLDRGVLELGGAYLTSVDLVQDFYDTAGRLRHASRETIQLAVLDGPDVIYLARHDGEQPVRLTSGIGRRMPATCTATGKALLARMADDEVRLLVGSRPFETPTPYSIGDIEALVASLHEVRARGYAVDDQETAEGVVCYGVAVPAAPDADQLALSVTLLKARDTELMRSTLVGDLNVLANHLGTPLQLLHRGRVPTRI